MKRINRLVSITIVLFFTANCATAQLYKVELDEKIQKSSVIIEGKVIAQKSFWDDAHTMIYTANTIKVSKLFKGTLTDKTIEIVTQGGAIGNRAVEVSDLLQLDLNKTGIFFCKPNEMNLKSPVSKKTLLDVYSSDQGFLRYDEKNDIASAPFAKYKGIEKNLHKLIQQKTGKTPTIIDATYKINKGNASNVESGTAAISLSSFSPLSVHGGALNDPSNNRLTIIGSGFGATPSGQCAVMFKDGNNDNTDPDYEVPYTSSYIVSWSNTKIVIKVPGRAATGKIAVVASDGTVATSSTALDIFYSVLNAEFIFTKGEHGADSIAATEPRLMNTNTSGGYTIVYSTSTAGRGKNINTADEKTTFQRALTTWKEQIGVNFIEGGTTTVQAIADDDVNAIVLDNDNTGKPLLAAGVLATTYSWFSVCYERSPFKVYVAQKTGFDVLIRNKGVSSGTTEFTTGPCFPSSQIDLEMVVLHELGHALNLAHINDDFETSNGNNAIFINPGKLMHYAITNYVDRRSLDASAYQGGLYTVKQQNNTYGNCLATSEMTPLSYIVIPNDDCPGTFPSSATPDKTIVNFDLVHATSNKLSDPQFTAINCGIDNGQFVTNNAFYAIKTSSTATSLKLEVGNYVTTPADQKSLCNPGQGVRLAVYDVSTCPTGQQYPQPIACATFTGNGTLSEIKGLESNHNYLLYFDGLRNTKANFDLAINGDGTFPTTPSGEFSLKLGPNPVHDDLTIKLTDSVSGKYQFIIYDMLGRAIRTKSQTLTAGTEEIIVIPMVNVARGMYVLKIIDANGNVVSTQKIMKGF